MKKGYDLRIICVIYGKKSFIGLSPGLEKLGSKHEFETKTSKRKKTLLRVVYATDFVVRFCDLFNMHALIFTVEQCALKM